MPSIHRELGGGIDSLEWTVNAYTLSFAVLLLTGAALGDRFGRRRMFSVGLVVFTLGSAAAALAPSIGARVAAVAPDYIALVANPPASIWAFSTEPVTVAVSTAARSVGISSIRAR